MQTTSEVSCTAYATYINAGLRGSRFMGECEVRSADGEVSLTGHRMPAALVWVRAACYVVFVPWIFVAIGAAAMVSMKEPGWQYPVAIAAAMFIFIAVGLGGGDMWSTYRAPVETVSWTPSSATSPSRKFDRTASAGPLAPTAVVRLAGGRCVTELRVPVGPGGKLRLLALRTSPEGRDALARALSGLQVA